MNKPFEQYTLQELAETHTGYALSKLLTQGGEGLRSAIFTAMSTAIQWRIAQDKAIAEVQKKAETTYAKFAKAMSRQGRSFTHGLNYRSQLEPFIELELKKHLTTTAHGGTQSLSIHNLTPHKAMAAYLNAEYPIVYNLLAPSSPVFWPTATSTKSNDAAFLYDGLPVRLSYHLDGVLKRT